MYRQVHADFASQCGRWWPVICLCLILVDSWPSNQSLPPHMLRSSTMRPQYTDLFRRLHRFVYRLHSSGTACHDERQYRRHELNYQALYHGTLAGSIVNKYILLNWLKQTSLAPHVNLHGTCGFLHETMIHCCSSPYIRTHICKCCSVVVYSNPIKAGFHASDS